MAVRSHEAPASSSPAIDAVALHDSNESTLVECVVAALRQARSRGRDIHAECCRSIFQHRDFATVIALPLALFNAHSHNTTPKIFSVNLIAISQQEAGRCLFR